MAYSLNKIQLIGNVGQEPELKYSPSGTAHSKFSIATTDSVKKDGEWVNQAEWHNITMFGKVAELFSKLIKKGSKLFVEGKLKSNEYDGKKYWSVIVNDFNGIVLLDKKETTEKEYPEPTAYVPEQETKQPEVSEDDLPF